MEQVNQEMREMMSESFGDQKLNKSKELNERMTISQQSRDEYEAKTRNIGGEE